MDLKGSTGHSSLVAASSGNSAARLMLPPLGDDAVGSRAQDEFGRTPFADAIAAQVASTGPGQSVVFGVVGPWGSGKTSLLLMVAEALREDHDDVTVLSFNPWLFSGTEHLVGLFFTELGAQLSDMTGRLWQDLGEAMKSFGELLGTLRTVPLVGGFAAAGGRGLEMGGSRMTGSAEESISLRERKNRLAEALGKLGGKKLVIMVDDLDRLRRQEIRDIVALVRLNADLPNILFVLAYDRERVEKALGEHEGEGQSYLEKIVQVVHNVPEARAVDLKSSLLDAVNEVTNNADSFGPYDPGRVIEVLNTTVFPLVRTMRDVRRYTNSLPVTLKVVRDEVALADVLGLEALRLFLPNVYAKLSGAAEALTTPSELYSLATSKANRDEQIVRDLIAAGEPDSSAIVEDAVHALFPASLKLLANRHSNARLVEEWGKERRVANWRILRFFLDKRLPQDVLPAQRVQEIVEAFGDPDTLRALLEGFDLDDFDRLLLRLQAYPNDLRPADVLAAVPVIANRFAHLMEEEGRYADFGAYAYFGGLMSVILDKFQDPDELARHLELLFPEIDSISARLQLATIVGHRENTGPGMVTEEYATQLEEGLVTQLENTPTEKLAKEYDLPRLLVRARQFDEDRGSRLIADLAEDDDVFLSALRRYYQWSTTGIEEGSLAERQPVFHWNTLCSLFGEEIAKRRVRELYEKYEPQDLDSGTAEALYAAYRHASGDPIT